MKRYLAWALLVLMLLVSQAASMAQSRRIVVFNPNVAEPVRVGLAARFGRVVKPLPLVDAVVAELPPAAEQALANIPGVVRIDPDVVVQAVQTSEVQWGVARVNAPDAWPITTGAGVNVGVIDTGISATHPDLSVAGGVNTINGGSWNDDNGHGTHVAGIIAALWNGFGVVGVAPSANLYAIKALNNNGSGYLSDIIEGIDWAIQHGINVINMSLGTSTYVQSFQDAVARAYNAGVVQVAAAGNDGPPRGKKTSTVEYPGKFTQVICVAASDSNNQIAKWSSVGPEVDLIAPGVSILSTYLGTSYATLSGTSMAAPHVAGAAALVLSQLNSPTVDEVKSVLYNTATDLGLTVNQQGHGLVNAYAAVLATQ